MQGDMRGRTLGFPTANIRAYSPKKLIPRNGIYFVGVRLGETWHAGIASIGVRPTFGSGGERILEVYIMDFENDIYGSELRVAWHKRLRDEQKFESVDALIQQMKIDREQCARLQREYAGALHN
jgi:riboflavin kinase/FMN adenylyltransferase